MSQPPSSAVSSGNTSPAWAKNWGQVAPHTIIGQGFVTYTAKFVPYTRVHDKPKLWFSTSYETNLLNENASNAGFFYFTMPDGMLFRIHPGGTQLDVCLDNVTQIPTKGGQFMVLSHSTSSAPSPSSGKGSGPPQSAPPAPTPIVTPGPVSLYQAPPALPAQLPAQVTVPVDDTTLVLAGIAGVLVLGAVIVLL